MTEIAQAIGIIEDSDLDFELTTSVIREFAPKFEIFHSTSLEDSLALIERRQFALLIVDLNLTGISGTEIVREIRLKHPNRLMRIVVFSSSTDPRDRISVIEAGADDFFSKPSKTEVYMQVVKEIINKYA